MEAQFKKYTLEFKRPSGTSRGVMTRRDTWFLLLGDGRRKGIGECGPLPGLSPDDVPDYEQKLEWSCRNIDLGEERLLLELRDYPSIQFGLEQAFRSLGSEDPFELFPSDFTQKGSPIPINGLIWMGDGAFMREQLEEKLEQGFRCLKMKVGALDFQTELSILKSIRARFGPDQIELRVDANGAFSPGEALDRLERLSEFGLHSIEQPIRAGARAEMAGLCRNSPLPIALDEELIGQKDLGGKRELLQTIKPQYIILKPSLVGGFAGSEQWIDLARELGIGWWVTSALESNIGLSAIAQWTHTLDPDMPQGLGTGSLYTNNFESPLEVRGGELLYDPARTWDQTIIERLCI